MDSKTRLLHWLLTATKGGPTRVRILNAISENPMNTRKLSLALNLDYKTVQGHIEMMVENGVVYTLKKGYGSVYFISPEWEESLEKFLVGGLDGKKKQNK